MSSFPYEGEDTECLVNMVNVKVIMLYFISPKIIQHSQKQGNINTDLDFESKHFVKIISNRFLLSHIYRFVQKSLWRNLTEELSLMTDWTA